MLADVGAPAVLADAPLAVMLADAGAPAVLAPAPGAVMLADAGTPAVLAGAPDAVMLADGSAPAVLAFIPAVVMLADAGAPAVLASVSLAVVLALLALPVCSPAASAFPCGALTRCLCLPLCTRLLDTRSTCPAVSRLRHWPRRRWRDSAREEHRRLRSLRAPWRPTPQWHAGRVDRVAG
jgi:hypothetical protein